MANVLIIGAGASGLMAAGTASAAGHSVTVLERNEKPGRKLMITGKGRCNVTNDCAVSEMMTAITKNPRFLYGALARFAPADTIAYFEGLI